MLSKFIKEAFSRFTKIGQTLGYKAPSLVDLKKSWHSDYVIETGPVIAGVQYYYHKDIMSTPCQRYLYLSNFLQEYEMRFDREYLLKEIEAREKLEQQIEDQFTVKGGAINLKRLLDKIGELKKLTMQAKERLELIVEPDMIYKIASVVYFDEKESPGHYDAKYGIEKIQRWRNEKATDFFLTMPLQKLLNLKSLSEGDLETYFQVAKAVKKEHLETIFTTLSNSQTSKDLTPS